MRNQILRVAPFILIVAMAACSAERNESSAGAVPVVTATDTVNAVAAAPAGVLPLGSPERKLIHAANINAEVPQLYGATSGIESMTARLGGQVSSSTLRKEFHDTRTERSGSDSLREFRRCSGIAELHLRVPVANLDTLLSYIAMQTSFIGERQVRIDDATFRYLGNALRNDKFDGGERTVAGASRGDGLEARQYLDGQRDEAVTRELENLQLDDQAAYANLSIVLTQADEVVSRVIPDMNRLMKPGPGEALLQSLRGGWELLYGLLLALLGIWPVVLGLVVGALLLRRKYRQTGARPLVKG